MNRCFAFIVILFFVSIADAQDAPVPPREAPLRMTVPDGFKVTLFAGEPDVVQPIAMCFDHRGRLWVVECLSYPKWHTDLTQGKDRVLIFEDTDNDGTFDKRTVFRDKLCNLSGIQVGFGGVWLCATPHLLFIPDKNGDDVPDGEPQILLDGWDKKAIHNVFNSLNWGLDGWLYGCHGITATVDIGAPGTPIENRTRMNCGVWRYHPARKKFEVVASGTTNPWGLDWNEHGQMFVTNCVIDHLWHIVPGGRYERMYGQDLAPHTYGLMKSVCDHLHWGGGHWTTSRGGKGVHSEAGGGHAHSGCMIYLGDNWPERYRGGAFMLNLHGSRINHDILERKGSSYVARHAKDFLHANDPWFRGLAILYGPDGGVYVSDWCDTGECHNYNVAHTTSGRIFKVTYGKAKNPGDTLGKGWDLSKLSDPELVWLHTHANEWYVRLARRLLQERRTRAEMEKETLKTLASIASGSAQPTHRLRALWTLHAIGATTRQNLDVALKDPQDYVRAAAITIATEQGPWLASIAMSKVAPDQISKIEWLHLASAAQRNPSLVERVLKYIDDSDDAYLPLMTWHAVAARVSDPGVGGRYIKDTKLPLVREFTARRLAAYGDQDPRLGVLVGLLPELKQPEQQLDVLKGIQAALGGVRQLKRPSEWETTYPVLIKSPSYDVRDRALSLAVQFGDQRALDHLRKLVVSSTEPATKRQSALAALVFQQKPDLLPLLQDLLKDSSLRSAAIKGLAAFDDAKTPSLLLKQYAALSSEEKGDVVQTLASRPKFALALLDAIELKQVPRGDLNAFTIRQMQSLKNKEVDDRLTKVWGTIRPASAEKSQLMAKYKAALTPGYLKKADLSHGRLLYKKTCASCHRLFDDGVTIGPDLTGSQRFNLDYVLENILDPSAIVSREFRVTVFTTTSGRTLTGTIKQETDRAVTVQTQNEIVILPKDEIDTQTPSNLSMMPENQLEGLTMEAVRDLIGYLASQTQVPLK